VFRGVGDVGKRLPDAQVVGMADASRGDGQGLPGTDPG